MGLSSVEYKSLKGLFLMRNSFEVPEGSMEEALNVVVSNDDRIASRRGFYRYFDLTTGVGNNLFLFLNTLFCVYNNKLTHYSDTGDAPNQTGSEIVNGGETVTVSSDRISENIKQQGNMYFTTDLGVRKLESVTAKVMFSGSPMGLDLDVYYDNMGFVDDQSPIDPGKTVGYRIAFCYTDANKNLILGAPSSIKTISYPVITGASFTSSGSGIYTVTVTTVDAHGFSSGIAIEISDSTFTSFEGEHYQITVTGANTFTFEYIGSSPGTGTMEFHVFSAPKLYFTLPQEIVNSDDDISWFYRIYRSSQQDIATGIYSDFKLAQEVHFGNATKEIGYITTNDIVEDIYLGAELYTNENSGQGEAQANFMPPLCNHLAVFKDIGIFANIHQRSFLTLTLTDASAAFSGQKITFTVDGVDYDYFFVDGIGNNIATCALSNSSTHLLFTYNDHGFLDDYVINFMEVDGGSYSTEENYYVVSATANTFKISLTQGGAAIGYDGGSYAVVEGVQDENGKYIIQIPAGTSAAANVRDLTEGIVKAVNTDPTGPVYGQYASTPNEAPGKMNFFSRGFLDEDGIRVTTDSGIGFAFIPQLSDGLDESTIGSEGAIFPNALYLSKQGIFEAVPLVNVVYIGAKSAAILGVRALRDSVIIIKEDGVFRMTGDTVAGMSVTILDNTILCVAPRSIKVLNNEVYFLSNQGVCKASDNAIGIISREGIEDLIQPILGQTNLASQTSAVAYETNRTYQLTTTTPNDDAASACYIYNILTGQWTESDKLFKEAVVGPNDVLYALDLDDNILRERKSQTRYDYSDQNHDITIDAIDGLTLTVTMFDIPRKDDMIVKDEVITWIETDPIALDPTTYTFEVNSLNNLEVGDAVILYGRILSRIKWSPFHGKSVGVMKLWNQMLITLRMPGITRAVLYFSGYNYGGSEEINWESLQQGGGWGEQPWGLFPWGQQEGIELTQGTQPADPIRVYIPQFQARTTFLQPILEHSRAGEPLEIQSIGFLFRAYKERPTR